MTVPQPSDESGPATPEAVGQALDRFVTVAKRFIAFHDDPQAHALALFCAATWSVQNMETVPYIEITGPEPEVGKTTAGTITGRFCYGSPTPLQKMTPASLRRSLTAVVDATVCIDELDTVDPKTEYGAELFGAINGGYNRISSKSMRADVKSKADTIEESTFGFKILIGIDEGNLPATTLSRCIPIVLQRAKPGEVEVFEPTRPQSLFVQAEANRFADTMTRLEWAWESPADCGPGVVSLIPKTIENGDYQNRTKQLWRPLVAIAEYVGGDWLARAGDAVKRLSRSAESTSPAILVDIAHVLFTDSGDYTNILTDSIFATVDGDALPSSDLLRALLQHTDGRWEKRKGEYGKDIPKLSAKGLASLLGRFDVHPKLRRDVGESKDRHRSYLVSELVDSMERYGVLKPSSQVGARGNPEISVTCVTSAGVQGETSCDKPDPCHTSSVTSPEVVTGEIPIATGDVTHVTDKSPDTQTPTRDTLSDDEIFELLERELGAEIVDPDVDPGNVF